MKKVLILTAGADKNQSYSNLARTASDGNTKVEVCSYQDLAFYLDGDKTAVTRFSTGEDIREFSKLLVLSTPDHAYNYIFSALSCYCRKYGVTMMDDTFTNISGKLYELWRFWENDIPVAKTIFGPKDFMIDKFQTLGGPGILKSVHGTKGKDSYLINSKADLEEALAETGGEHFVLQNFVPNDGDWRIILINFEPKLAIYRSSHGKDFRNNTSLGGDATLIPLEKVDARAIELSVAAAKSLNIKIAGADIIADKNTGEYTVLEVNRTPQLISGAFVDAKADVLKKVIQA